MSDIRNARTIRLTALSAIFLAAATLGGCSGSDDSPAPAPVAPAPAPPAPPPLAPQGLIALNTALAVFDVDAGGDGGDGAPLAGATIVLTDADGKTVTGRTGANGGYLVRFRAANFRAPFVMKVLDASNNVLASVNELTVTSGFAARTNINPLTDKVLSDALAATAGGTDKAITGASVNTAALGQAKTNLLTSVQAALGIAGVANPAEFDPVRSVYKYDGTGVDAIIESIGHARDPVTGATQLRAKLAPVETDANGTAIPTLITASTPLDPARVAISTSPALTFQKLNAWVDEVNRCLALSSAQQLADVNCRDADGTRLVHSSFKHNSRDFTESLRTLFSESDGTAVQGSTFRNPQILFTSRSTGSTVDDISVVEFTVRQPRTGPLSSNLNEPVEYTTIQVFRRFDTLTQAKAGNWLAHGNQRDFNNSVQGRFIRMIQHNPLRQANAVNNDPSTWDASINFNIATRRYDVATRTYVPTNVRAVRITGPGLPAAGIVFVPSSTPGTDFYVIHNKIGRVDATAMTSSSTVNSFRLAAVAADGSALFSGYWNATNVNQLDAPLTSFAPLQAYSRYRQEIFLNSNPGNTTPDDVEDLTLLASLTDPNLARGTPLNDFSPSLPLITPPAAGGCSFVFNWVNNPSAAPASSAFIFGRERNPKNAATGPTIPALITAGINATLVNRRLSTVTLNATDCEHGRIPDLTGQAGGGDFRQIGLNAVQGRIQYYTYMSWTN